MSDDRGPQRARSHVRSLLRAAATVAAVTVAALLVSGCEVGQVDWNKRTYTASCWDGWSYLGIPASNLGVGPRSDLAGDRHAEQVVSLTCGVMGGAGWRYGSEIRIFTYGASAPQVLATIRLAPFNWYGGGYGPVVERMYVAGGKLHTVLGLWTASDCHLCGPTRHADITWTWTGRGFTHWP